MNRRQHATWLPRLFDFKVTETPTLVGCAKVLFSHGVGWRSLRWNWWISMTWGLNKYQHINIPRWIIDVGPENIGAVSEMREFLIFLRNQSKFIRSDSIGGEVSDETNNFFSRFSAVHNGNLLSRQFSLRFVPRSPPDESLQTFSVPASANYTSLEKRKALALNPLERHMINYQLLIKTKEKREERIRKSGFW